MDRHTVTALVAVAFRRLASIQPSVHQLLNKRVGKERNFKNENENHKIENLIFPPSVEIMII